MQNKYTKAKSSFKEGEIITMIVCKPDKTIIWKVGSEKRAEIRLDQIGDYNTKFVPFIELFDPEDCI